jgi:hypothetical protein
MGSYNKASLGILPAHADSEGYLANHSPRLEFDIILSNYPLIECNLYYLYHRDAARLDRNPSHLNAPVTPPDGAFAPSAPFSRYQVSRRMVKAIKTMPKQCE